LSLHAVDWISGAVSASLSLLRKIAFPDSDLKLAPRLEQISGKRREQTQDRKHRVE
jgi:hypothetical protein